jgi:hypothetical protein
LRDPTKVNPRLSPAFRIDENEADGAIREEFKMLKNRPALFMLLLLGTGTAMGLLVNHFLA